MPAGQREAEASDFALVFENLVTAFLTRELKIVIFAETVIIDIFVVILENAANPLIVTAGDRDSVKRNPSRKLKKCAIEIFVILEKLHVIVIDIRNHGDFGREL